MFNCVTSHKLAQELLSRQDDFITVLINDREYSINGIKRVKTHANSDDSICYWSIICDTNMEVK